MARIQENKRSISWILVLISVAYIAFYWSNPFNDDMFAYNDFPSYVHFSEYRTAGYPVFLNLIETVFGTLNPVPNVQLLLTAFSVGFLGLSVYKILQSSSISIALVLLVFGQSFVFRFHSFILSESLFISLLCVMVGVLIRWVERPSVRLATVAAAACGLAVALRPAGLSLLAVWPGLLWLLSERAVGRRLRFAVAFAVPLALCVIAEGRIYHSRHGEFDDRPNFVGLHLFSKALLVDAEPTLRDEELNSFMLEARQFAEPLRGLIAGAPDWHMRAFLLRRFEIKVQWGFYRPVFRERVKQLAADRGVGEWRLLAEMGGGTLLARPGAWAHNAWDNYLASWTHNVIQPPDFDRRLAAYLDGFDYSPFLGRLRPHHLVGAAISVPSLAMELNRVLTAAAFLGTLAALGIAVWRRIRKRSQELDNALAIAATAALIVHSNFVLVGLFAVSQLRYSAAMWPVEIACGLLLIHVGLKSWTTERSREACPRPSPAGEAQRSDGRGSRCSWGGWSRRIRHSGEGRKRRPDRDSLKRPPA